MSDISISPDGFLWYRGSKLQIRIVPGGLQFQEKDKERAKCMGGDKFVISFAELLGFIAEASNGSIDLLKQSYTNEGERNE